MKPPMRTLSAVPTLSRVEIFAAPVGRRKKRPWVAHPLELQAKISVLVTMPPAKEGVGLEPRASIGVPEITPVSGLRPSPGGNGPILE
jgi:hypothetical protein